jgi:acetamidase/formamidase
VTTHHLPRERRTLHGTFDERTPPVLAVHSGDVVELSTLDAHWYEPDQPALAADPDAELVPWAGLDRLRDPGHALSGPVAIVGAEPGDVVEVRLLEVVPGSFGWTRAGGWSSWANDGCGVSQVGTELLRWRLDGEHGVDQHGDRVRLRPFLGVVGLCPAGPAPDGEGVGPDGLAHSTVPPRRVGGNLDCRELVAGSSLFLPVEVPGALLSVGDGHAVQGDGEVAGVALECPMAAVRLEVVLHRAGSRVAAVPGLPRATTPAGEITFGLDTDLNAATLQALNAMVDLLVARHGLSRPRALALCSVAVDLRVTQVVNRVHGVHAVLPPDRLTVGGA